MKTMKKLSALVLALVMVFAMSATAFAATGDPNFTKSGSSQFSTATTAGTPVTLLVGPADASYYYTGFTSRDDALDTKVSLNIGAGNCTYSIGAAEDTNYYGQSCYATKITVTPNTGYYGPISVHAVPANATSAWTYVDMTVYVEPAAATTVSNITVEVTDLVNGLVEESDTVQTVAGSGAQEESPFYNGEGCAQNYPTAGSALYALMGDNFEQSGGYVSSIDGVDADWTVYTGWNYCVAHYVDGVYVKEADGDIVSASVLPIQSNDRVIWAYGTSADAATYFERRIGELNASASNLP